jgi:hypothetical protein
MPKEVCCARLQYKIEIERKKVEKIPMTSIKSDAVKLLTHHRLTPEMLLHQLQNEPAVVLKDTQNTVWTFVSRHNCRRYLMAKAGMMTRFEEIYCSTL